MFPVGVLFCNEWIANMPKINRIVLIGFRGVGKTTIAKQLSKALNWQRVSTDEMIEARIKMKIADFVKKEGWPSFRQIETEEAKKAAAIDNVIIDCGGGLVEDSQNMKILSRKSLTVWVDANLEDIYQRLKQNDDRPLLNQADLLEDIETNYRRREKLYRRYSSFYVNTSQEGLDSIYQKVLDQVPGFTLLLLSIGQFGLPPVV